MQSSGLLGRGLSVRMDRCPFLLAMEHLARIELGLFRRRGASTVMGTDPRTWVPELAQSLAGCDTQAILLPTVTPGLLPCVLSISMATPGFLSRHSLSPFSSGIFNLFHLMTHIK